MKSVRRTVPSAAFLFPAGILFFPREELRATRIRHAAGHLQKLLESVDGFTL